MLCPTCPGSGHLLTYHRGVREFWSCPACGGAGVRVMYGPPTINIHRLKIKKAAR
jgi:ribosomal protein L37AE/L43A